MCGFKQPQIVTPTVQRLAAPTSDGAERASDFERLLRRSRSPMADILTTPLGLVGDAA